MSEMRKKALAAALSVVEKQAGQKPVQYMHGGRLDLPPVFSTGSLALDIALECGGFPTARFVEVSGGESSGKTTLCLQSIARAQKRGATCAFIDAEHALEPSYAQKLGVDLDELLVFKPDTAENVFQITETLVSSGAVDIIVIDSAAALLPKSEAMGITDDSAAQATLIGNALKKLTPMVSKAGTLVIFTNQIRSTFSPTGDESETTPCGHALKHYLSMRISLRAGMPEPNTPTPGIPVICKVQKNKLGPQYVETKLFLKMGIVREYELTELGRNYEVLEKKNGILMFGDVSIGKSTGQARAIFAENPELADQIEDAIRERAAQNGELTGKLKVCA